MQQFLGVLALTSAGQVSSAVAGHAAYRGLLASRMTRRSGGVGQNNSTPMIRELDGFIYFTSNTNTKTETIDRAQPLNLRGLVLTAESTRQLCVCAILN